VDISKANEYEITPLSVACLYENESIIKYLVEHEAYINGTYLYGSIAFIMACNKGKEVLVKYLVEHGADINKGNDELNPLFISS